jgi:hypothetical protein
MLQDFKMEERDQELRLVYALEKLERGRVWIHI